MSDSNFSSVKFKWEDFFTHFSTEPKFQFQLLISEDFRRNKKASIKDLKFWAKWNSFSKNLTSTDQEVIHYKKKMDNIYLSFNFRKELEKKHEEYCYSLKRLNLSKGTFVLTALLLRDTKREKGDISISIVNEYLLGAIFNVGRYYKIFSDGEIKEPKQLIAQEVEAIENLIITECDLIKIRKVFDMLVWEGVDLKTEKWNLYNTSKNSRNPEREIEGLSDEVWVHENIESNDALQNRLDTSVRLDSIKWRQVILPESVKKNENDYISSLLKEQIKSNFYIKRVESENDELKRIQPQIKNKLNQLLQSKPSLPIIDPASYLSTLASSILEEYGIDVLKNSIGNIYFPQENIDIGIVHIHFEGEDLLLKDIIYLIALLEWHSATHSDLIKKYELVTESQIIEWVNGNILFKENKDKSSSYFSKIIHLIAHTETNLPFSPLIGVGNNKYVLAYGGFHYGFQRSFYNCVITDKLFDNTNNPENNIDISKKHRIREENVCKSIGDWFRYFEPKSSIAMNFIYPKATELWGSLEGEIDDLIYFLDENLLFIIQLKLCNSLSKSGKTMHQWIRARIKEKAKEQINRDIKFIRHKEGANFTAGNGFKLNHTNFYPEIFPLIVTDVFRCDHQKMEISQAPGEVICISLFELECLLKGLYAFEGQEERVISDNNRGAWLRDQIMRNKFWSRAETEINKHKIQFTINTEIDKAKWMCNI